MSTLIMGNRRVYCLLCKNNDQIADENITFHRLTTCEETRPYWIKALNLNLHIDNVANVFICSAHFLESDFSYSTGRRMLRKAVPTVGVLQDPFADLEGDQLLVIAKDEHISYEDYYNEPVVQVKSEPPDLDDYSNLFIPKEEIILEDFTIKPETLSELQSENQYPLEDIASEHAYSRQTIKQEPVEELDDPPIEIKTEPIEDNMTECSNANVIVKAEPIDYPTTIFDTKPHEDIKPQKPKKKKKRIVFNPNPTRVSQLTYLNFSTDKRRKETMAMIRKCVKKYRHRIRMLRQSNRRLSIKIAKLKFVMDSCEK